MESLGGASDGLEISEAEFGAFQRLILRESGIALGSAKQSLVVSRLTKRLRALDLSTFQEYYDLLQTGDPAGAERQEMINCITTNKTSFFREAHHMRFLREQVFPALQRSPGERRFRVWSAGCSTGEEPYSIALTIFDHFPDHERWQIDVLASDIDTHVLASAQAGIYPEEAIADIPVPLRQRFFLRGRGRWASHAQVKEHVRRCVRFERINLIGDGWPEHHRFDVIFCRNVIIYFNRATQARLLARFADRLRPGGHLILGHSENIHAITDRFEPLGDTVYRLRDTPADPVLLAEKQVPVGTVHCSKEPMMLRTVLGSCVSACLFDETARIGGMNHFLLPEGDSATTRYGIPAMQALVREMIALGAARPRLRAKVFGAVDPLWMAADNSAASTRNAEFVRAFLEHEGIPVVNARLGGHAPIEVRCYTHTGRVLVRPVRPEQLEPGAAGATRG